ncbi:MAG: 50S ribosomal protein L3 [Piscirickettsiaceae bacterium]|jgi:large subunit ribosomal protein L3|nr:50S ribosomal protein L3 [Piscirickettsiaceae bacterium]
MTIGLVGRKRGMTRVFTEDGVSTPVTVIEVEPNRVSQLKTVETDGYNAVQVTVGSKKTSRVTKPQAGHFAKAESASGDKVSEFTVEGESELELGSEIKVTMFEAGQKIDVSGITKGKGFAGGVKRYGFRGGDATHGNSISHRSAGSIGQCQTPGRVFKNKKMAGHMGDVKRTLQNLSVVRVDEERNLLLVKGSVPGATGSSVVIRPAVKA